jgi:long-subunit fatty acid transport protein
LAYVFNKKGLISFDYSFKDYGNTEYSIERDSRNEFVNSDISKQLTGASEFRIGGEYKIKAMSLRAGYRFEQSPYKNAKTIGDLNSYSGGLGYNFGTWKLDLAYTYAERNSQQSFFSQGFTDSAKINTVNNNVSMTLAFEM